MGDTVDTFQLERLTNQDIPAIVALSATLGWDYTEAELRTVFAAGIVYGHRAADGELMTSGAIFPYNNQLASIGLVMVQPRLQGWGLGKVVTQQVITSVPSHVPIVLISTDAGHRLYERLGFRTVETTHKMIAERYVAPKRMPQLSIGYEMAELTDAHFEDIVRLDARAVGGERRAFLQARMAQVKQGLILTRDGVIVGYGLSIGKPSKMSIGSIVAPSDNEALVMIHTLAENHVGEIRIDLPSIRQEVIAALSECGFETVRIPPTMLLNTDEIPPRNNTLYAIAAQAFS